jgi:hypothetical protein
MASTNKTANYNLSQFVGSDKPAWLSDYNQDMTKIDTGIKNAADTATSASGTANAATTAIGDLTDLTTTAKTNLVAATNEINANATTAQSTASDAYALANTANITANTVKNQFNFTYSTVNCTLSSGSLDTNNKSLSIAKNSDGSIAKIYGRLRYNGSVGSTITVTSGDTGLRPTEPITFNGCLLRIISLGNSDLVTSQSFTLNTDGTITTTFGGYSGTTKQDLLFMANVLFITNFGDLPTSQ